MDKHLKTQQYLLKYYYIHNHLLQKIVSHLLLEDMYKEYAQSKIIHDDYLEHTYMLF